MIKENYNHLQDFIYNKFMNYDMVYRYSNTKLIERETDLQHIGRMQCLAMYFYDKYPKMKIKDILYRIFVHDLDEALAGSNLDGRISPMGDVPRDLKYSSQEMYSAIENTVNKTLKNNIENKNLVDHIKSAKHDGTIEGYFVNLLDSLQALIKLRTECLLQGSDYVILYRYKECLDNYNKRLDEVKENFQKTFWKKIYQECSILYDEFLEEYYKMKR